ncbi:CLUMA_CG008632, isoform A [Clunio marinus]|uniref:CLUMA_CG008632, isoform A n=1 Tax=Clunio marinus TaxID=568069 RepID=A0A1J1I4N6_9DIPT|nr:CLUMA_CG008632, isoform A [Clunio marinus]
MNAINSKHQLTRICGMLSSAVEGNEEKFLTQYFVMNIVVSHHKGKIEVVKHKVEVQCRFID